MTYGKKTRKTLISLTSVIMTGALAFSVAIPLFDSVKDTGVAESETEGITRVDNIKTDLSAYYDKSVMKPLPDGSEAGDISVIVEMKVKSLLDCYNEAKNVTSAKSVGEYVNTRDGRNASVKIARESEKLLNRLNSSGVEYKLGENYEVVFGGFEITVKASDYSKVYEAIGSKANLIVGEVYEKCETQVVENDVNVYGTGIFDSSGSDFDGSGTVVAVLDTGLDYTHTAFDPSRFTGDEVITLDNLDLSGTQAAASSSGLKAEDVYLNAKVPFAYDYADKDPDVYPIQSEHGTHVAGVIVGSDDVITGVAPNAQLAMFKVFSDTTSGAKQSWILSALEDCVKLKVDVINMSLGLSAGFAREEDKERTINIYNKIGESGISLVCAASNDYNSTFGSEKNGNLGLTSNPDSATVGTPSTYESALSVASISGVKRSYLKYEDKIIYFTESTGLGAKPKDFVSEILGDEESKVFDYVKIPGVGRSSEYNSIDVKGKIALIQRGQTSFEEKARIAKNKGAVGAIIYNNVSGDISMTVGSVGSFPVCSISQDNGEFLAKQDGQITISKSQKAGPFMSDFSSWGPTPSLGIKPEITAHGGEILSAVPGQDYDRLSGTSMASPNQAGVTALIRQYVKTTFPDLDAVEVTARVNQIMMSTTDIARNTNGLPAAVRKQGAGLANLTKATTTKAYITTFKNGEIMDKAKLELGDDPAKTGVYTMKFAVNNFGSSALTYDVSAMVMTEGVSSTPTDRGQNTVTEEGYELSPSVTVKSVTNGTASGNAITVNANGSSVVTVEAVLSEADKVYLEKWFANGMYVEGFVMLKAQNGVDLNVPFLAFYGDWTKAPMFDLDIFETNKDEIDDGIDYLDKTLPDSVATIPLGGTYDDYIYYLGYYAYLQEPGATKIAADRKYISLSNQEDGSSSTVNSIFGVYAGMLRGAKLIVATVTDSVTGEVIMTKEVWNQRKSYNGGGSIIPSNIDLDFRVSDYNLKNNTRYDVKLQGYLDYDFDREEYEECVKNGIEYTGGGYSTNLRNTFEFPFVTDFQAPAVTGCNFRSEYDASAKKTRLFADIDIYDNHYSCAALVGYIGDNPEYTPNGSVPQYRSVSFSKYPITLYSEFNSTYTLTYELTDYLEEIKNSSYNNRSFTVEVLDYAQNDAMYEINIPDSVIGVYFADAQGNEINDLKLSPNEVYQPNLIVTPSESWEAQTVNLTSSDEEVVRIVNGKIFAVKSGKATVTATSNTNADVKASITVTVRAQGDEGFVSYDKPVADTFKLTEVTVNKLFYFSSSSDRGLNATEVGQSILFTDGNYSLNMYPSESATVKYRLDAYCPDDVTVRFEASNENIVKVDETGKITAVGEGGGSVTVSVLLDGRSTYYSQTISINVKNPYITNSIYLLRYAGNGGEVVVPSNLGITEIYQFAFSGSHSVPKDENDEISEEDPYKTKQEALGDDTITKIVLPEGIETINLGAFQNLTALEEVVLPSTLTKIDAEAFSGCTKLKKINLEHVKFINKEAFKDCPLEEVNLASIVAIGNDVFNGSALTQVLLPVSAQSIGSGAFANSKQLTSITIEASKVKLGENAFLGCVKLDNVSINASVIPYGTFSGCTALTTVTLGDDVASIGAMAFAETNVSHFNLKDRNKSNFTLKHLSDGKDYLVLKSNKNVLVLVAPLVTEFMPVGSDAEITTVGEGAFSGNTALKRVALNNVTSIGDYAFAGCEALESSLLMLGNVTHIGRYAFLGCTKLTEFAFASGLAEIGEFAFAFSGIASAVIPDETEIGEFAFAACANLASVEIGKKCTVGNSAFMMPLVSERFGGPISEGKYKGYYYSAYFSDTKLAAVTIGDGTVLGESAFENCIVLETLTLGNGVEIGDYAFYYTPSLLTVDLSKATRVGAFAFSGEPISVYQDLKGNGNVEDFSYSGSMGTYTAGLETADLSSVTEIGAGAFYGMETLKTVTLGNNLTVISEGAFYGTALTAINLENITKIGAQAFMGTAFTELDLSSVEEVGTLAFAGISSLTAVTLKEGSLVYPGAFMQDSKLATVTNLDKVIGIGASAFAGTAITKADLSSAMVIGPGAFEATAVTEVVLGNGLITVGDNPFTGCAIGDFTNADGETTFELSDTVKVYDGVLYAVAPNGGLVLITYPLLKADKTYKVQEGTVRIGDMAFMGAAVQTVEFPRELEAIGDKAFYDCQKLGIVVFKNAQAPILEELYDENYFIDPQYGFINLPLTGVYEAAGYEFEGLGIVPYYSWTLSAVAMFYGANFVNYVGKVENPLVMIRPTNGDGYESFVMGKYFDTVIDGAAAPYQDTIAVIKAIAALPSNITLEDEAAVVAARELYNKITSNEQLALITNYSDLTSAESTIRFLKGEQDPDPVKPDPDPDPEPVDYMPTIITLAVLTGVFGAAAIALAVILFLPQIKKLFEKLFKKKQ